MAGQGWNCTAGRIGCVVAGSLVLICGLIGAMAYLVSGDSNVNNQGQGDDLSVVQKSSGFHVLEVNAKGLTCENQGWVLIEIVCVLLAIGLGLTLTQLGHYCYCKKVFKGKVKKALLVQKSTFTTKPPEVKLEIPALVEN